ncbi:MAG TPA: bifunctional DedA family/phosphatase PAP2 family protein [Solirubrobacterales bacterium]
MSVERVRELLHKKWIRWPLIAALAVGAYLLVKALLPEVDLQEILDDVAAKLGDWTYLVVGVLAFLETGAFVGLVAPGETFVILGGAVAGVGETNVILTLAIVWFSAWAGDTCSFFLGVRLGRGFILRHGPKVRITEERFAQVEGYFKRHGGKTILIGRFVGLVRALAPFTAGSSGMEYRAFVPYSILGTGLWATTFVLIGYFAARSLDTAAELAGRGTLLFGITVGVIVAIVVAVRYLRVAEHREHLVATMEGNAALRPLVALGRRLQPQARFLWQRLTPGGLGLEFTTLLAAFAVGSFVLIGYAILISDDPSPTPGDMTALEIVRDIHTAWLTDLAKAVTELGAAYVVLPLAGVAAVLLVVRRRFAEAAVLVVSMVLIVIGIDAFKDATDRPRPPDRLVDPGTSSYPSGHAAYSVFYTWAAVAIAFGMVRKELGRRLTVRGLVLTAGIALTAVVGLTRVYLRAHYLSDVNGGWALGVCAFALCGMAAILILHLRNNGARGEGGGPAPPSPAAPESR